jgi:c-src tyrosine kinase
VKWTRKAWKFLQRIAFDRVVGISLQTIYSMLIIFFNLLFLFYLLGVEQSKFHVNNRRDRLKKNKFARMRQSVTLAAMPWYHGKISREDVERLFCPKTDGLFLIRDSTAFAGDYTLSVCFKDRVEHYHIMYANNKLTIDNEGFFKNLEDLVQHYMNDADGLVSRLLTPMQKQGSMYGIVSMANFKEGGWVISQRDVELGAVIGGGDFGDVYQGTYKGQVIAAKKLKDTIRGEQPFLLEAAIMTSLKHSNVLKLIGVTEGTLILVTEFMEKGSLLEFMQTRGRTAITKRDQINFSTNTCSAMDYLNGVGLIHRDLAARNILISGNGEAKVSDFGLANFCGLSLTCRKFPLKWTAPEAHKNNIFTSKSDMWSFGIVLWEIYSFGRVPYPKITHTDVTRLIEGGYRMEAPEKCPPEIYEIMRLAWEIKPENRPTFREVLSKLQKMQATVV